MKLKEKIAYAIRKEDYKVAQEAETIMRARGYKDEGVRMVVQHTMWERWQQLVHQRKDN